MINIQIPNNNVPEREYIIDTILSGYLGLEYSTHIDEAARDYVILINQNELIIKDSFFSNYPVPLSYQVKGALPKKVVYSRNAFASETDIPVIYGNEEIVREGSNIRVGVDIFASAFFMLTRWEEFVNMRRDEHARFRGEESIAFKNGFLHRPIVNEYVEMLWNLLQGVGYKGERAKRYFELVLTHDIDALTYVSYKTIIGDIWARKNIKLAWNNSKYLIGRDPFDTYDFLMKTSEDAGVKSHFYFMSSSSKLRYDPPYYLNTRKFSSVVRNIKARGHVIGFHPGYYTFEDYERWTSEKAALERAVKQPITEGRQHFLRMDISRTLSIWDSNQMEVDSTLGYSDKEGFRCGTGDEYRVFDFLSRKPLFLKERPLIIMDGTLLQHQKYSYEEALKTMQDYIAICKKYQSKLTILFHNSIFAEPWQAFTGLYQEALLS